MDETLRSRILDTLVARRADQFRLLQDLVRTRSENPPGDMAAVSDLAAEALKALNFGVERHAVPDDQAARHGMGGVVNLVARHEFAAGPVVALAAFGDTGPAGEGWTRDPFDPAIERGVLTGLGAVTKADLVAYAHALAALRDAGPDLSGTVELHFTFDGAADGDLGPKWLLGNAIVNPDYVVASGFSHAVGTATMGDLQMEVALGAMVAAGAVPAGDPMQAASRVLDALYDLAEEYRGVRSTVPGIGQPSLVVGQVRGGARPDRRPDEVVLRLDRRLIPDEDPAAAEDALTRLIAAAASEEPDVVCRVRRLRLAPPMTPGPASDRLAAAIAGQAAELFGTGIPTAGVPTDVNSRHYAAVGIPAVLYGAGPATAAEARVGGPDERLVLDDFRKATAAVALGLAEFLAPAA